MSLQVSCCCKTKMDIKELTPAEKKNVEGLNYLTWDMFDSPGEPGSGYNFMEREPVLILDQVVHKTKRLLNVELGYVSKIYADKIPLPTKDSHRVGKAIRLRIVSPKKRMDVIKELILFGVERIAVNRETVYFDTDDLKPPQFALWT
jgi:hypothetical protein